MKIAVPKVQRWILVRFTLQSNKNWIYQLDNINLLDPPYSAITEAIKRKDFLSNCWGTERAKQNQTKTQITCKKWICLWWVWRWHRRENLWDFRDRAEKGFLRSHFSFPIQRFLDFFLSSFPIAWPGFSLKRLRIKHSEILIILYNIFQ